ncbi:hypothetical protein [Altericista sp. CCNU0014]|uniref:hypothetical protein n=1 Tax=Altericista sp. CCNU0014 TaxID=3082949 RepID=UPI00384DA43F
MLKRQWHSGVAILTALSLGTGTVVPLIGFERPAAAGIFAQQNTSTQRYRISQNTSGRVLEGTSFDVVEPDGKRIIVTPDETARVTLETSEAVRSQAGTVLIPRGTRIEGEFRPAEDGTQFVARRIIFRDGTEQNIDGSTNIVNERRRIQRGTNTDPIWQGALVGGAASAVISSIVTRPGIFKTLAGAGAGALAGYLIGGRRRTEVIVVEPDEPLTLTLDSDLVVRRDRY